MLFLFNLYVCSELDGNELNKELICRYISTVYNYYHFDQQGSTLFLTGNTGLVTDRYSYDAWGNLVTKSGSTGHPFLYVGKYGYYAHYQDEAVLPYTTASLSDKKPSFLQTGARQYFPKLGRYLQEDPAMDGLNWFVYCNNDPVNAIDPDGNVPRFIAKLSKGAKITCTEWSTDPACATSTASVALIISKPGESAVAVVTGAIIVAGAAAICKPLWMRSCSGTFDLQHYDVIQATDPANSTIKPTKLEKNVKKTITQVRMQKKSPSNRLATISDFFPGEGLFK